MEHDDLITLVKSLLEGDEVRTLLEADVATMPVRLMVVGEHGRAAAFASSMGLGDAQCADLAARVPSPLGAARWILVLSSLQLGSLREKQFLAGLGGLVATHLLISLPDLDEVPESRRPEIRAYAIGLAGSSFPSAHLIEGAAALNAILPHWSGDAESPGRASRAEWSRQRLVDITRARDVADATVKTLGNAEAQADELDRWDRAVRIATDALETGHIRVVDRGELARAWGQLVGELERRSPSGLTAETFETAVQGWLGEALPAQLNARIAGVLDDARVGLAPSAGPPALEVHWTPHLPGGGQRPVPDWLRFGAPALVGVLTFLATGPLAAVVGAGVTAFALTRVRLSDPGVFTQLREPTIVERLLDAIEEAVAETLKQQAGQLKLQLEPQRAERVAAVDAARRGAEVRNAALARALTLNKIVSLLQSWSAASP